MAAHDCKQKKIYRAYIAVTFLQERTLQYRPYCELCDGQCYCTLQQQTVQSTLLKQPVFDVYFQLHIMIYLTAIGLTPGGSSTVHIYTQIIHRTTQSTQNNT
jgi:hypothetical protein